MTGTVPMLLIQAFTPKFAVSSNTFTNHSWYHLPDDLLKHHWYVPE
jgi:hypothetical protein